MSDPRRREGKVVALPLAIYRDIELRTQWEGDHSSLLRLFSQIVNPFVARYTDGQTSNVNALVLAQVRSRCIKGRKQ